MDDLLRGEALSFLKKLFCSLLSKDLKVGSLLSYCFILASWYSCLHLSSPIRLLRRSKGCLDAFG